MRNLKDSTYRKNTQNIVTLTMQRYIKFLRNANYFA